MKHWIAAFWHRSVGKKQVVGVTGLALLGFLAGHLAGNLAMLKGAETFDAYAHFLESQPLLIPVELVLLAVFLLHVVMAIRVTLENWGARPVPYAAHVDAGGRTLGSATMIYTGAAMLAFLLFHVTTFKFMAPEDGSLFEHVIGYFRITACMGFYVIAMVALGIHLSHGVRSVLQTFGIDHPRFTPAFGVGALAIAAAFAAGFGMLPPWGYFRGLPQ